MKEFFLKKYKTLDEQIELLRERGLTITDTSKTKRYILTNNYYNIINGYSKYFCSSPNKYLPSATFDEICNLYYFDKEMKNTLFQAILEAEGHIKSIMAYRFSEAYQNKKYAYLDINSYDSKKILDVSFITSKLFKIINNKKTKKNTSIHHYYNNHGDVPIWVIVDYLEFGDIVSLIENLPVNIQNKISRDLLSFINENLNQECTFTPEQMVSFLKNIREIRNVCAHNNRLLEFTCKSDAKFFDKLHSQYNLAPNSQRRNVYSTFCLLSCFISKIEFAKLNNTIRKRMRSLDKKLSSITINTIMDKYGFPKDWHEKGPLSQ